MQKNIKKNSKGPDGWSFFTNHAYVVFCLAQSPDIRLREVAEKIGITERAVQRIVADLESAGYISRIRNGRRNTYEVHLGKVMRLPLQEQKPLDDLIQVFNGSTPHTAAAKNVSKKT